MTDKKVKLLHAKKETLYFRVCSIAEHAKDIHTSETIRECFLNEIESLDQLREDFENIIDEINERELSLDPSYVLNYQPLIAFDDSYCRIKRVAKTLSAEVKLPKPQQDRPRLPAIQIPEFDGDVKNWSLFYECFKNTIHTNPGLSDSEKLYYLIGRLTGKARSVCAGVDPRGENYSIILQSLIDKYEDKRLLATSYLDHIYSLKSMTNPSANDLEYFIDKYASSVAALKNLNIGDLCDFILLYTALKKLDTHTARLFEVEKRDSDIPSFNDLVLFLRNHVKILNRTCPIKSVPQNIKKSDVAVKNSKFTHAFINTTTTVPTVSATLPQQCSLCSSRHEHLYRCHGFQRLSPTERFKHVKANRCCINCLSAKHLIGDCNSSSSCRKCQRKHHSMLHFGNNNSNVVSPAHSIDNPLSAPVATRANVEATLGSRSDDVALCTLSADSDVGEIISPASATVLLATARVVVINAHGKPCYVRALLDSASQSNFITRDCCTRLGLTTFKQPACTFVKGIGGAPKPIQGSVEIKFSSRFNSNVSYNIDTLVVDMVTERLPLTPVNRSALCKFDDLPLADDTYASPGDIEMLIGASLFPHLLLSRRVQGLPSVTSPYALETVLGFVILGTAPALINSFITISCCALDPLDALVRQFWEMEEISVPPILSPEDRECEQIYSETTTRDETGRYSVALPFKGDIFSLGDSTRTAEKRFFCLERKLQASAALRQAYDDVIKEYLGKGYLSLAPSDTEANKDLPAYVIPHHGVIRDDKVTSKLRIVLDASAKTSSSVSLNDILYSGQNLQGSLFKIILNFRVFAIALSADIRQMFLCIGVRECDRRFQRILYRFSPDEPLKLYQFNRVCFGLKSSPFHALRTIAQLVADEGGSESFSNARQSLENSLYMDDYVYCVDQEDHAISVIKEMIDLMEAGQFDLVKWMSNSQSVLSSIPESHRLSAVKEFDDSASHKILGLSWSPVTDFFSIKITPPAVTCTKRAILSCIAKLWDVMGFVAPVVLLAKLFIKQLWLEHIDWDDKPPANIIKLWNQFCRELPVLNNLNIPRHVGITSSSVVTVLGFADASEKAYGGVVYLHVQNKEQPNAVHLVCAKSKVSPTRKVVSLARLELCAALVLTRLMRVVIDIFSARHPISNTYAFSDSTVTLCWIHSSPHRWDTFVANRVAKIQAELPADLFYHVPGIDNPADCLSRGLMPAQIIDHPLWFTGPPWASSHPSQWPIATFNASTAFTNPPEKKIISLAATETDTELPIIMALSRRLSSWSKLLRIIVYIYRFCKVLPLRVDKTIFASDLDFAENRILREVQSTYFANEIASLRADKLCGRRFRQLKPFLHEGLVKVGGRLNYSDLGFAQRHPIILPRKDHIIDLLVDYHHKFNCHAGPDLLMSILRQKYWIMSARNLIRSRVHKCIPCFRLRPKPNFPEMADHKYFRVTPSAKPFTHTGTDFAGPLKVTMSRKRGVRSTKAYICLFVCMTTRAVHIELASDLSTASFMSAFKRFLSRRGPVCRVYSDNGTNFIGAKRSLSELHAFLCSKHFNTDFAHILTENRITWVLNTPAASHFGGNWETNVKSLKMHLFRVIGDQVLTFEELCTVLAQVEAVMNTRPLCRTLSSDPSEPLALTPAHFLNYTPLKYLPAPNIDEDRLHVLSRHALLDKLVQSFWKRWRADYLHTLQTRQKWNASKNNITVGTIVILINDNVPPLHWPLGIVEEVFPAIDGVIRVVKVKTATGSYLRPVVRICPLPN